jgi:hypothetical protein
MRQDSADRPSIEDIDRAVEAVEGNELVLFVQDVGNTLDVGNKEMPLEGFTVHGDHRDGDFLLRCICICAREIH